MNVPVIIVMSIFVALTVLFAANAFMSSIYRQPYIHTALRLQAALYVALAGVILTSFTLWLTER